MKNKAYSFFIEEQRITAHEWNSKTDAVRWLRDHKSDDGTILIQGSNDVWERYNEYDVITKAVTTADAHTKDV